MNIEMMVNEFLPVNYIDAIHHSACIPTSQSCSVYAAYKFQCIKQSISSVGIPPIASTIRLVVGDVA